MGGRLRRAGWSGLVLAVGLAGLLAVGGCDRREPPAPAPGTDEPTGSVEPTAPADSVDGTPVIAYFVWDEEVVAVRRYAQAPAVAAGAIEALLLGPSGEEAAEGIASAIPAGTRLNGVTISDGVATVDFGDSFDDGGGTTSMSMRVAQVVFTLTQFDSVRAVTFEMDGRKLDVLGGEGILLEEPQTREMWEDYSPAVLIEHPAWGDEVDGSEIVRVLGTANVFEAEFDIDVANEGGVLLTRHLLATSGSGTRGSFYTRLGLPDYSPGRAWIAAWYSSPKDGAREELGYVLIELK